MKQNNDFGTWACMAMDGSIERTAAAPEGAEEERLRAELRHTQAELARLRRRFALLSAEASLLSGTLAAVYASRSWRITAPLRAALTWPARRRQAPRTGRPAPAPPPEGGLEGAAPRVSVIVSQQPAQAGAALVETLRQSGAGVPFEVPLPRSPGAARVPEHEGVRTFAAPEGAGPAARCNAAAAIARGAFVALWDGVSPPLPGWLAALESCFSLCEGVGMAGAALLDGAGRIAAAGATIGPDARLLPRGAGAPATHPDFAHVAAVEAVPLGALMLPAALWRRLGGLDEGFGALAPALTDLGLRVAETGASVVCSPFARLRTAPPPPEDWATAEGRRRLRRQVAHFAAFDPPRTAPRRALFVDHFVPTPDRDSGSADLHGFLRIFVGLGYETTLLAVHDLDRADTYVDDLRRRGVRVVAGGFYRSLGDFLAREAVPFDLFMVYRATLAEAPLLDMLRRHSPQARLVFNTVDLHFLRLEREAALAQSPALLDEAFRMQQRETAAILRADCTILLSPVEQRLVAELIPAARTRVIPILRDIPGRTAPFAARRGVLFVGSFRHRPNVDAIVEFVREVWPLVRRRLDLPLTVIGADPPPEVRALAGEGVVVAGYRPDLDALLGACRLTVAPLRFGAGLKGKIVSSLAAGVPCVATPMAAEGMALIDGEHVCLATTPSEFAAAVVDVHEDTELWERLSRGGLLLARETYSLAAARWRIAALLDELGLPAGPDSDGA
ncbi:MAG: glycosyltransferase [Alphaproteobacteria bacterium]|nr:glycosyltransferase [Alphaproteobacteria bacterium]